MLETLQKVVDSEYRAGAVETTDPGRVLAAFKRYSLTTGRAVYAWSPDGGLYRLGNERVFVPHTRSFTDALGYIAASRHYGIYLMQETHGALSKPSAQRALQRILTRDDDVRRLVLFVGDEITIPDEFRGQIARIRHRSPESESGASG